ncbi:hypothetical protein NKG05_22740 [Oerskovia sp. M15]
MPVRAAGDPLRSLGVDQGLERGRAQVAEVVAPVGDAGQDGARGGVGGWAAGPGPVPTRLPRRSTTRLVPPARRWATAGSARPACSSVPVSGAAGVLVGSLTAVDPSSRVRAGAQVCPGP